MKRSSNSAIVCFVSMYAQMHSVSSFNDDDDFTKTVFIIRKDKECLFTGSAACSRHTGRKDNGGEPNSVFVFVCL